MAKVTNKSGRGILITVIIAVIMNIFSFNALADIVDSGQCGDNLTWTLNSDGLLTISGTGNMWNWTSDFSPWYHSSEIKEVVIEYGVTSIPSMAFYGCDSLTSVSIGNSVTSIPYRAFYGCDSLTSVSIGNSVTSIDQYAFYNCGSLTSIIIPDSVTSIGYGAFNECDSLTSISIPSGVTSIGDYAFWCCRSLTSVSIGNRVTSIGDRAFAMCESLTSIDVDENNSSYVSIDGVLFNKALTTLLQYPAGNSRESYSIPGSVTSIGNDAFEGCSGLTSVSIPSSVTSIGDWAFNGCYSLTSVNIPDSVTSIGKYAFNECDSLTSVNIPDSVTSISCGVFYNCGSLTSVNIPDSVTSIGDWAFAYCYSLTSISIPSSVTSIGEEVFEGYRGLTSVSIPSSVTSIGEEAFRSCKSLTSVSIPNSVTSIGDDAFYACNRLTDIYYEGSERQWNKIRGNNNFDNVTVHYAIDETPTLTSYIGYDENGELAIMFDAGDYNEGNTVEITSELGNTVYSGVVTDEKNIFAITPKNANVTYTAKITLEDGTVLEEKAALYQALAKDCAENLEEYANVDLSLINREGIASGVKAISEGGAVLVEGKLTAEAASIMDVSKNEKETVISIKPQLTRIGLGFGYYEGSKIYAGSGVLASADSYGIYSRITIDNETGAAVLNNGVVAVTSTFGAEAVPIPANAIIINDNTGESVEGFDYWK